MVLSFSLSSFEWKQKGKSTRNEKNFKRNGWDTPNSKKLKSKALHRVLDQFEDFSTEEEEADASSGVFKPMGEGAKPIKKTQSPEEFMENLKAREGKNLDLVFNGSGIDYSKSTKLIKIPPLDWLNPDLKLQVTHTFVAFSNL